MSENSGLIDVEELEKILNDDKEFKRWTIETIYQIKKDVQELKKIYTKVKQVALAILAAVLSKIGVDFSSFLR